MTRHHCYAFAITGNHVVRLPIKALACALDKDPTFAEQWINMLNAEIRQLRVDLEGLSINQLAIGSSI
jgi:CRP-like cAMP-binding protein